MTDAPDTRAASVVTDHPFRPRTEGVTITMARYVRGDVRSEDILLPPNRYLCAHANCRLAEAAHLDTTVTREEKR